MALTQNEIHICNWIGFGFGLFSLICSLITLALIYKMEKNNGYLKLIASTTLFQLLYDINYIIGVDYSYTSCISWHFLDVLGGLSVAIWTNIVSFIILYVVTYIKSVDIFGNYKYFFLVSVVPPLLLAILAVTVNGVIVRTDDDGFENCGYGSNLLASFISEIYYWGRLVSIIVNFAVFFFISWRLQQMAIVAPTTSSPSITEQGNSSKSTASAVSDHQGMAIYTLVSRMKYYPLVQALRRSGAAWNEFDGYKYDSFASFIMASICSPSTGACYFAVFLIMQPNALRLFRSYCLQIFCCQSFVDKPHEVDAEHQGSDQLAFNESMFDLDEATLEYIINEDKLAAQGSAGADWRNSSSWRHSQSVHRGNSVRAMQKSSGDGSVGTLNTMHSSSNNITYFGQDRSFSEDSNSTPYTM